MTDYVEVPAHKLTDHALEALIEEFVTREGTDYGLVEHSLEQKTASVRAQLERGEVVVVFDPEHEFVTLALRRELNQPTTESRVDTISS